MDEPKAKWKLLRWANLGFAAVGVVTLPSALSEVVPSLIIWSDGVHWLIHTYRNIVSPIFALLPFRVDPVVRDVLVLASTVVLTLNIESWIQDRRFFLPSFAWRMVRQIWLSTVGVFQDPRYKDSEGVMSARMFDPTRFVEGIAGRTDVEKGCLILTYFVGIAYMGLFGSAALVSFLVIGRVDWFAFFWPLVVALVFFLSTALGFMETFSSQAKGHRLRTEVSVQALNLSFYLMPRWRQFLSRIWLFCVGMVVSLPVAAASFVIIPIVNSWRSVGIVVASFCSLLLLNEILLRWIDPMLRGQ